MRRSRAWRPWLGLLPVLASLSFVSPAAAAETAALAEARAWLQRIQDASRTVNYRGTMVNSSTAGLSSSRVWRYGLGSQTFERLEALDGRQHQMVRHNDTVHTVWPQNRVVVIEKREALAAWSTTPQSVDPQALEHYRLTREGVARIAGRDAAVLLLEPLDNLRYSQRLWSDLATGLVLRADVLAPMPSLGNGPTEAATERPVIESTAFSEVEIGVKPQPESILRSTPQIEGFRVVQPVQRRTTLEAEGWRLARPVPGFPLAGCVKRGMAGGGPKATVLQSVFSDGLTHVSLFVEPFRPEVHVEEMRAQHGATSTLMLRRGDTWVTVVGDVPVETLHQFSLALERKKP